MSAFECVAARRGHAVRQNPVRMVNGGFDDSLRKGLLIDGGENYFQAVYSSTPLNPIDSFLRQASSISIRVASVHIPPLAR